MERREISWWKNYCAGKCCFDEIQMFSGKRQISLYFLTETRQNCCQLTHLSNSLPGSPGGPSSHQGSQHFPAQAADARAFQGLDCRHCQAPSCMAGSLGAGYQVCGQIRMPHLLLLKYCGDSVVLGLYLFIYLFFLTLYSQIRSHNSCSLGILAVLKFYSTLMFQTFPQSYKSRLCSAPLVSGRACCYPPGDNQAPTEKKKWLHLSTVIYLRSSKGQGESITNKQNA